MAAANPGSKRGFARRAFALVHPYWSASGERGVAWGLLLAIVAITLGLVYLNVQYNYWNRNFFNALEKRDTGAFWTLIPYFFGLSALTVAGGALQTYLTQMLQMRWRVWMTGTHLDAWLAAQAYYRLEHQPGGTDNPDQRIAEDLKQLTANTLELSLGFLHNTVTLVSFIAILWSVSAPIVLSLSTGGWSIPGDMVWAALAYAIVGSLATYVVGRPLIGLRFQQERLEADMRFGLMRTREHAEGIALYRGETAERRQIDGRIDGLKTNWWQIMAATLKLNTLSGVYTQLGILVPYFLTAPRYFAGTITLGGLTQTAGAFDTVRVALSWFVFNYQALAAWKASVDRLLTFESALEGAARAATVDAPIHRDTSDGETVAAENLSVGLPDGRVIVRELDLAIGKGERVMIMGPPGAGKSTLFRAFAGLWPFGSGRIRIPAGARVLFLPQKPYLPVARLIDAVTYPAPPEQFSPGEVRDALARAKLGYLSDRLDEVQSWGQILSGGEQQKLAIARALLNRPQWLFLDEATAALDQASEADIYGALVEALPDTAIVSIAHRAEVKAFHARFFALDRGRLAAV